MKGKLIKFENKWYVEYLAEPFGDNHNWFNKIPIIEIEYDSDSVADLRLVEIFNKPVNELDGLEIEFTKILKTIFEYSIEYAKLKKYESNS